MSMSSISGKSRPSAGRPQSDKSAAPVPAPRRSSVSERESFITDCKAAYLAVYSSLNDEIESKQDLCTVLQQAGRSPTSKVLSKYWKANTESLTFDDFCDICRKEPVTSEDDLIRLFQKIDVNGDGYISNSELRKLLTSRGERMTADEVQRIINDVDDNGDGKLDYYEFAKMIVRTQEDCKVLAYKNMERKLGGSISKPQASPRVQQLPVSRLDSDSDDDIVIGSSRSTPRVAKLPTYKSDESSKSSSRGGGGHDNAREWTQPGINARQLSLTKPKTLRDWKMVKSKGCFLFDDREKILSHQYSLKLSHDSQVWITIEPLSFRPGTDLNSICEANGNPVDMMLFVLNVDNALVAFSEQRDAKGKYALNCELTRGSYQVLAFTSGCRFKPRVTEPRQTVELVQKKGGRVSLNKPFKDALYDIFDMCDLTCNNLWSRDEFRLYNLLTSGQELDDSLWEVVEEKIELQNDQITREGFLTLVQMEAEDSEEDLWVNLTSMGFNKALVMDQASPFMIEVYTERGSPSLKVTKLEEGGKLLTAALVDMVKRKGLESSVRGSKDLHLYSLVSDFRCCFVVENKSPGKQGVVLDCRKSENVVGSHQNGLSAVVDVPSRQSVVVQHLLPKKESQQWTVVCHDSVR